MLTNCGFDSDTVWVKGTGTTISGGLAQIGVGSTNALSYTLLLSPGARYQVRFTVTAVTSGSVASSFAGGGGTVTGVSRTAVGTYVETLVATHPHTTFRINGTTVAGIVVDNVSLRRIR